MALLLLLVIIFIWLATRGSSWAYGATIVSFVLVIYALVSRTSWWQEAPPSQFLVVIGVGVFVIGSSFLKIDTRFLTQGEGLRIKVSGGILVGLGVCLCAAGFLSVISTMFPRWR